MDYIDISDLSISTRNFYYIESLLKWRDTYEIWLNNFFQLMDFLPQYEFFKCVERYLGNLKVPRFICRDQFFCTAFAHLIYRESLAMSKSIFVWRNQYCFTWGFAAWCHAIPLPMSIKCGVGASTPILPKRWLESPVPYTPKNSLERTRKKRHESWIPPSLASVGRSLKDRGSCAQNRTVLSVHMLAEIEKKLRSDRNLYTILQILSVSLFEKIPVLQAVSTDASEKQGAPDHNQLNLFD